MRRNLNKFVAAAIGLSIASGNVMPVLAADVTTQSSSGVAVGQASNTKPVLTLDDAIKSAISSSEKLALYEKKLSYQDKINDINEEYDDNNDLDDDQQDFNDETRKINLKKIEQQRDFDTDKLMQDVTTAYNNIITTQMKIVKEEKNLQVKTKDLNDAKLKKSLGLMISVDLKATELQIENLQNAKNADENILKDAQYSFKVLTGKDVIQYSLEQDIPYDVLKIDDSVDEYLDNVIDKYLKYSEQLNELNNDYYSDNDHYISLSAAKFKISDLDKKDINDYKKAAESANMPEKPEDISTNLESYEKYMMDVNSYQSKVSAYTGALGARLTYLNTKLGVYQSDTTLNENKKQFKDNLRKLYSTLLATEDGINTLKKNIELNNEQLRNAKLKCDLGLMTKSEYNAQVVSSEDLKLQLRTSIDSYNTIKEKIQKPWIAFS